MQDPIAASKPAASVVSHQDRADLLALNAKINALLPPQYQNCYDAVKPVSMGSAGLVFGTDGKVAWDQIWTSFCELALAGGPPHRGTLLEPASPEETFAAPELYQAVVEETSRGIWLVTELPVLPHAAPGWIGVRCQNAVMASWLARAIVVENVSARRHHDFVYLPAGPNFQLDKEIKNVVTAMAKTHHYWAFHMPWSPWSDGSSMTASEAGVTELLEPALAREALAEPEAYQRVVDEIRRGIRDSTGLPVIESSYLGWVGVQCANVDMAIWLMRALVVENVMVRTEHDVLYLPASPAFLEDDKVSTLVGLFSHACHLWEISGHHLFTKNLL